MQLWIVLRSKRISINLSSNPPGSPPLPSHCFIFVSAASYVRRSGVINVPVSDHLPAYVELKVKSPKPSPQYISARRYTNFDPELFTADVALYSDSLLSGFDGPDVNIKLDTFNNVFRQVLDVQAPMKTIKIRNRPCPLVTNDIKELMKARDSLHRRFLQTCDASDWARYRVSRYNIKRVLVDAKRTHTYQEVQINKSNPSPGRGYSLMWAI